MAQSRIEDYIRSLHPSREATFPIFPDNSFLCQFSLLSFSAVFSSIGNSTTAIPLRFQSYEATPKAPTQFTLRLYQVQT